MTPPITEDGGDGGGTAGGGGGRITSQAFPVLGSQQLNVRVTPVSGDFTAGDHGYEHSPDGGTTWVDSDGSNILSLQSSEGPAALTAGRKVLVTISPSAPATTFWPTHVRIYFTSVAAGSLTFEGHTAGDQFTPRREY